MQQVVCKLRIRGRFAAKACHRAVALPDRACRQVRRELAQIAQAGGDDLECRIRLLHRAHAVVHAGHALERVLVRDVGAVVVRAVDMRVEIRVADGHVEQLHAQLLVQTADQIERLGQVDLGAALRAHAPAVRMDKAVVYVQAGGDNEVLARGVHRVFDAVAQQAGAVVQAAAERALAGVGGEQFAVQVAVAALDVHAVKACALGQLGRLAELLLERHQIVV